MTRDVKVGLFVAATVIGLTAILLGGGLIGRSEGPAPPLRVDHSDEPAIVEAVAGGTASAVGVKAVSVEARQNVPLAGPAGPAGGSVSEPEGLPARPEPGETLALVARQPFGSVASGQPSVAARAAQDGQTRPVVAAVAAPRAAAPAVAVAACKPEEDLDELADYEIVEDFPDLELEDDPLLSLPPGLAEPRAVTNGRQAAPVVPPVAAQAARPAERAASPVAARMPAAPARAPEPRREMPSVGPAASKATPVPAPSNFYIVKEGESFFSISKKLYDAAKYFVDIQKANPDVTPQRMRPGDIVVIPEVPGARLHREHLATEQDLKALRPGPTVRLAEPTVHVIALGETLQAISKKYYDRYNAYDHILEANPGLDPRKLVEGTQIVIPALTD